MDSLSNSINDIAIKDDKNETSIVSIVSIVNSVSVLNTFKAAALAMIDEKQITIPTALDSKETTIDNFLHTYTENLSQSDKNSLICEYGMAKAYKLYHRYYTYGLERTDEEFCDVFEYEDYKIDHEIILLIISEAIGYKIDYLYCNCCISKI